MHFLQNFVANENAKIVLTELCSISDADSGIHVLSPYIVDDQTVDVGTPVPKPLTGHLWTDVLNLVSISTCPPCLRISYCLDNSIMYFYVNVYVHPRHSWNNINGLIS